MSPKAHHAILARARFPLRVLLCPLLQVGGQVAQGCMVIVVAVLVGLCAIAHAVVQGKCSVLCADTIRAYVYDLRGTSTWWRVVYNRDVPLQVKSGTWDVAMAW